MAIPGAPAVAQGGRGSGGLRGGAPDAGYPAFGGSAPADPGEYTVVLTAGGRTVSTTAVVLQDVWFDRGY